MGSKAQRRRRKLAIQKKTTPVNPIIEGSRWSRATVGSIPPGKFHSSKKGEKGYDRKGADDLADNADEAELADDVEEEE